MTRTCPRCSAPSPAGEAFCHSCGFAFPQSNVQPAPPPAAPEWPPAQAVPPFQPVPPAQSQWQQPAQPAWQQPAAPGMWSPAPGLPPAPPKRAVSPFMALIVAAAVVIGGTGAYVVATQVIKPAASQDQPGSDQDAIVAVLQANIDAMNNEDVTAYMACLDPSSPAYDQTKTTLQTMFATYRLYVELSDVQVRDVSDSVAHVHVVITTRKLNGPAFKDNRVTAVMELHKVHGDWKIYGQTISGIDYL